MKILILLNSIDDIKAPQTTAMLAAEFLRQGHELWLGDFSTLQWQSGLGGSCAAAHVITQTGHSTLESAVCAAAQSLEPKLKAFAVFDILMLRINPARSIWRSSTLEIGMDVLRMCSKAGVVVLNNPDALLRTSRKSYLGELPTALTPKSLLSTNIKAIEKFLWELEGPAVIKPVVGTRGEGVFRVESGQTQNLKQTIELLLTQGPILVQEFVGEIGTGDIRVVVCDGDILNVDGHALAIRRLPAGGDFRSNIHQGGRAVSVQLSDEITERAKSVAKMLKAEGIWLSGLDFVENKIIEVNVWATGGFRDAEKYYGVSFCRAVIKKIEDLGLALA